MVQYWFFQHYFSFHSVSILKASLDWLLSAGTSEIQYVDLYESLVWGFLSESVLDVLWMFSENMCRL